MNCPTCGRLTWTYDDDTLTCKAGHHISVDEPVTDELPPARIMLPAWLPGAVLGGGAVVTEIVRALS